LCFESDIVADDDAQRLFDDAIKAMINDIKLARHRLTGSIS
jgi:hypothetical protein